MAIRGLDEDSHAAILRSVAGGRSIVGSPHAAEFVETIGVHELWKWQSGLHTAAAFADTMTRKAQFFYRSKEMDRSANRIAPLAYAAHGHRGVEPHSGRR